MVEILVHPSVRKTAAIHTIELVDSIFLIIPAADMAVCPDGQ